MAVPDDATYIPALSLFLSSVNVLCDQCGSFVYGLPLLVFIVAYQASWIRDVAAVDKWSFSACATTHFIDAASSFCLPVSRKAAKAWPRHWSRNPFLDLSIHRKMRWPLKLGQEEDSRPTGGCKCAFSLRENDDGEQSNMSGTVGSKGLKGFTFSILSQL